MVSYYIARLGLEVIDVLIQRFFAIEAVEG